jgi:prefoldin beta subunit
MNEEDFEKLRQQLQVSTTQKQTLQLQYNETKHTLEEVDKVPEGEKLYELVGQILMSKDKKEIAESLRDRIQILEIRLKSIDKTIDSLTAQIQEMQNKG